jgi:5'(3')-deoxyribonucleotidase
METARRYNKGKTRYELIPEFALKQLAEVYTRGAHKYSIYRDEDKNVIKGSDIPMSEAHKYELMDDGADNWKKGLPWKSTLDSVKRHIEQFREGEDFDSDLGTYHLANAAWGLLTILEYYKIYPQGDDRNHKYLNMPKIGLDIDEVLADWVGHWTKYHGQEVPETWNFDRDIKSKFDLLKNDKEFWLSIPPKINPSDIDFEPHCYITSRSIPLEWTQEWIDKNGFPTMPVYSVEFGESKVEVAKKSGIDIFVDDRFENFVELNNAGICCYLFDAPHNKRYNVGYKRIFSLKELI